MGKKRVIKKTKEELLKEKDVLDQALKKGGEGAFALKGVRKGRIYINVSYNNTIITITDSLGNVLTWASAGSIGFKGTRKSTPFAASKVAEIICERLKKMNINEVAVLVKGIGSGRESAIRTLGNKGINITSIKDTTPVPHGGCRPPKARRV